ncbi:hypothetical protein BGZ93_005232 [Podila epicladia]|nr:hypothetical protein BGZ92_007283 [Podila epicladia]KAG0095921.1 hypothetical protein BGZ93_005232 [Podila epicladia]
MTVVQPLHILTPLVPSPELSRRNGVNIWLKLENIQPSGSFKIRGLGHISQKAVQQHGEQAHLVCSSGGNAGLAVAYAGRKLGVKSTIVVPTTTSEFMKEKIVAEGATVVVEGEAWDEADKHARAIVAADPHAVYMPPFDHADVWKGNSTMIPEIKAQLGDIVPDAVVCSVGGGGLINGIILGLQEAGWNNVPVLALETNGANSFQQSFAAGKLVTLPKITSIATTLGAKTVSAKTFELSQVHPVVSHVVEDAEAVSACHQFLSDHRFLVEPSCGAALAAAYTPGLFAKTFPHLNKNSNIVMIVCGGSNINFEILEQFKNQFGVGSY